MLKKSDYFYELPEELIAQTPAEPRDSSRLLVYDRKTGKTEHRIFRDIKEYLKPGDVLVVNNTKVLPARMYAYTKNGGKVEVLLLKRRDLTEWEVLVKPGKKAKVGTELVVSEELSLTVRDRTETGERIVDFHFDGVFEDILSRVGSMPLPPYITEKLKDKERYQTVYSRELGSAAAPTAGLHFTQQLLERLKEKGIRIGFVTLHVGLGTFRPVNEEKITDHKMHSEHYHLPAETAELINRTKQEGGRVIAVGTTSCRTLESVAAREGEIRESDGWTDIFIYPGFTFRVLDGLITNFHLPESTLIMLVSALAGYDHIMNAYKIAVQEKYRFFSFGDAMLII